MVFQAVIKSVKIQNLRIGVLPRMTYQIFENRLITLLTFCSESLFFMKVFISAALQEKNFYHIITSEIQNCSKICNNFSKNLSFSRKLSEKSWVKTHSFTTDVWRKWELWWVGNDPGPNSFPQISREHFESRDGHHPNFGRGQGVSWDDDWESTESNRHQRFHRGILIRQHSN